MTSAPRSPRTIVAYGPARTVEQSMTRMPSSGPGMAGMVRARLAPGHLGAIVDRGALADPVDEVAVDHDAGRGLADDVGPHAKLDRGLGQRDHRQARPQGLEGVLAVSGVQPPGHEVPPDPED